MNSPSSALRVPTFGELHWCILCTGIGLLGNGWLVLLNVPAPVLMAYASASCAFAFVANLTVVLRRYVKRAS